MRCRHLTHVFSVSPPPLRAIAPALPRPACPSLQAAELEYQRTQASPKRLALPPAPAPVAPNAHTGASWQQLLTQNANPAAREGGSNLQLLRARLGLAIGRV